MMTGVQMPRIHKINKQTTIKTEKTSDHGGLSAFPASKDNSLKQLAAQTSQVGQLQVWKRPHLSK